MGRGKDGWCLLEPSIGFLGGHDLGGGGDYNESRTRLSTLGIAMEALLELGKPRNPDDPYGGVEFMGMARGRQRGMAGGNAAASRRVRSANHGRRAFLSTTHIESIHFRYYSK